MTAPPRSPLVEALQRRRREARDRRLGPLELTRRIRPLDVAVNAVVSVDLGVPEVDSSRDFFTRIWGLRAVEETAGAVYLRGSGPFHHILALHKRPQTELLRVTVAAPDPAAVDALQEGLVNLEIGEVEPPAAIAEPGGGYGFSFRDPDGRVFRIVSGSARHDDAAPQRGRPVKLAHVVLNAADAPAAAKFLGEVMGFRTVDETRTMIFLSCNHDHHSLALERAEGTGLNHLAFEMPDLESVMRASGRLRDYGYPIDWGVGRHGPGNNVFAFFIGPNNMVLELTAEMQQIDESYRPRGPDEWVWPPGRTEQWGIALGPTRRLLEAEKRIKFAEGLFRAAG